jgi:hypothetical protein
MDVLKTMVFMVRTKVKDLAVKVFHEAEIVSALNEGKNECVKIIRQANENYFEETYTGTISTTASPNYAQITLPTDFSELRNLQVTNIGLEDTTFTRLNQSDPRFRTACLDSGSYTSGLGIMYWDFVGKDYMIFAPAPEIDLGYKMHYIKTIPDMGLPDSYPIGIPAENFDYIVTWAICECMRTYKDNRLDDYLIKLEYQRRAIIESVNTRQVKEPQFVTGYMENEYWG